MALTYIPASQFLCSVCLIMENFWVLEVFLAAVRLSGYAYLGYRNTG
jgi:hypothetical protein